MDLMSCLEKELSQEHTSLLLFPNNMSRRYWTNALSRKLGCIGLNNFINFTKFQTILQEHVIAMQQVSYRVLTSKEQMSMILILLEDKQAQSLVYRLEQVQNVDSDNLSTLYAKKLLRVFNQYIEYLIEKKQDFSNDINKEIYSPLHKLLTMYDILLQKNNCIDSISLTIKLQALKNSPQITPPDFPLIKVKLLYPDLLAPLARMWIHYFGVSEFDKNLQQGNTLFHFEELNGTSSTSLDSVDKEQSNSILEIPTQKLNFSSALYKSNTQANALHIYDNTSIELEAIFASISSLIHQGISPHEIALSVCGVNEQLQTEVTGLARKYQIPLESNTSRSYILLLLSLLDKSYSSNFNPHILKQLFFEPVFKWKCKDNNYNLVCKGIAHCCLSNKSLNRWHYVLENTSDKTNNPELSLYFFRFVELVSCMVHSSNFKQLYKYMYQFFDEYFEGTNKPLGRYEKPYDTLVVDKVLYLVEEMMVFEYYLSNTKPLDSSNIGEEVARLKKDKSVWQIFLFHLGDITQPLSYRRSQVHQCEFPQSLAAHYSYHYICNISQALLVRTTSRSEIFNEFLGSKYKVAHDGQYYLTYKNAILSYIQAYSSNIYLSGSHTGPEGAVILPTEWPHVEISPTKQDACDIWSIEQAYWLGDVREQKLSISKNQREGLEFQKQLQLDIPVNSLSQSGIDKNLYPIIYTRKEVSLAASNIKVLLNAHTFLFDSVLQATPYLPTDTYTMDERRIWGIIYHKLLAQGIAHEKQFLLSSTIHEDIDANSSIAVREQYVTTITQQSIETLLRNSGAHSFIWNMLADTIAEFDCYSHLCSIKSNLQETNRIVQELDSEKIFDMNLKQICDVLEINSFDDFINNITIHGKADLILALESGGQYIIDYKLKPRFPNLANMGYLIQLWIYHIMVNAELIEKKELHPHLSDQNDTYMGNIYFITGSQATPFLLCDKHTHAENSDKNEQLEIGIKAFIDVFQYALEAIRGLNAEYKTLLQTKKEVGLNDVWDVLVPDSPLHVKLILREGCYVYRR